MLDCKPATNHTAILPHKLARSDVDQSRTLTPESRAPNEHRFRAFSVARARQLRAHSQVTIATAAVLVIELTISYSRHEN